MTNYTISNSGIINIPSGLYGVIEKVDVHPAGAGDSATLVTSTTNNTYTELNTDLNVIVFDTITITTTGTYVNIGITWVGDQSAYRLFDKNINHKNAGQYPGRWGTGIGSLPMSSIDDKGYNPYTVTSGFSSHY